MDIKNNDNQDIGAWGEKYACSFLEEKGFDVIDTNWHFGHKEIDIIARKNDVIVFVEVKTRTTSFTKPADAVTKRKQKFLLFAADNYLQKKGIDKEARFDVISIVNLNGKVSIEHIENAFYPCL